MKLDKAIVQRRIDLMAAEGIVRLPLSLDEGLWDADVLPIEFCRQRQGRD